MNPFLRLVLHLVLAFFISSGLVIGAGSLYAASQPAPRVGYFLIADETMNDPRFHEAVILLVQADQSGVVGLVINRPSSMDPTRLVPELTGRIDGLYFGGPVSPYQPMALLRSEQPPAGSSSVLDGVSLAGVKDMIRHLAGQGGRDDRVRVYLGYAGWAPGQLAAEIARGSWQVAPADKDAVFSDEPEGLWQKLSGAAKAIWI